MNRRLFILIGLLTVSLFASAATLILSHIETFGTYSGDSVLTQSPALLPKCTPNEGYRFLGWSEDENASAADYKAGLLYPFANDCKLYAVYEQIQSTTSFELATSFDDLCANPFILVMEDGISAANRAILALHSTSKTLSINSMDKVPISNISITDVPKDAARLVFSSVSENAGVLTVKIMDQNTGYGLCQSSSNVYWTSGNASVWYLSWAEATSSITVKSANTSNSKRLLWYIHKSTFSGTKELTHSQGSKYLNQLADHKAISSYTDSYQYFDQWRAYVQQTRSIWRADFEPADGFGESFALYGAQIVLPKTGFVKTGYDLVGWKNQTGDTFVPGEVFKLSQDTTFYPIWAEAALTLNAGEHGTCSEPTRIPASQSPIILPECTPNYGYRFLGWSENKNDTAATYSAGTEYRITHSVTLYAIYKLIDYEVQWRPISSLDDIHANKPFLLLIEDGDALKPHYGYVFIGSDAYTTRSTYYSIKSEKINLWDSEILPKYLISASESGITGGTLLDWHNNSIGNLGDWDELYWCQEQPTYNAEYKGNGHLTLYRKTGGYYKYYLGYFPYYYKCYGMSTGNLADQFEDGMKISEYASSSTNVYVFTAYIPDTLSYYNVSFDAGDGVGDIVPVFGYKVTLPSSGITAPLGYQWTGWTDGDSIYSLGATYYPKHDITLTATFAIKGVAKVGDIIYGTLQEAINNASSQTVELLLNANEDARASSSVSIDGNGLSVRKLIISSGSVLTIKDHLYLDTLGLATNNSESSQLVGEELLHAKDAYMDIVLNPNTDEAINGQWYTFSVPFKVDVASGVQDVNNKDKSISEKDFLIWEYDGQLRAENKDNGWVKLINGVLTPGHSYMIGVTGTSNVWRFTKQENASIQSEYRIPLLPFIGSSPLHSGWNAMANALLTNASVSTDNDLEIAQVYENGAESPRYVVANLLESDFPICAPFFLQSAGEDLMELTSTINAGYKAPKSNGASYAKLQLMLGDEVEDMIYVTPDINASDSYTIGKDVAKMMGGEGNNYLYVVKWNTKLCAHHAQVVNGQSECPIEIYTSNAGTYQLRLANQPQESVYLTKDNNIIWNLTTSAYPLDLQQGTNTGYGLLISANGNAPTRIENQNIEEGEPAKWIMNGNIYIKQENRLFNVLGIPIDTY